MLLNDTTFLTLPLNLSPLLLINVRMKKKLCSIIGEPDNVILTIFPRSHCDSDTFQPAHNKFLSDST